MGMSSLHRWSKLKVQPIFDTKLHHLKTCKWVHLRSGPPSLETAATNLSWRSGVQRKRALAASAVEYVTGGDVPKEGPGLPSDAVSEYCQSQQGQVMVENVK